MLLPLVAGDSHLFVCVVARPWDYMPLVDHNTACILGKLGQLQEAHQLMSTGLQREARTYRPVILLGLGDDYAAVLADAGFARLTNLLLSVRPSNTLTLET